MIFEPPHLVASSCAVTGLVCRGELAPPPPQVWSFPAAERAGAGPAGYGSFLASSNPARPRHSEHPVASPFEFRVDL
jgi:hypothetical protein